MMTSSLPEKRKYLSAPNAEGSAASISERLNMTSSVSGGVNMNFAFKVAMEVLKVEPTGPNYENLACSPLSISAALCVLVAGSEGPTRDQLLGVMEHNSVDEVSDMASRLAEILKGDDNDENAPDISYAYALWVAHPLTLKKDFKQILWDLYKTKATTLDFHNQVDKVVDEANLWAEKQSKGLIKQILSRNCITKDTAMILANALYFKGVWVNTFDPKNTQDKDFNLLNGNKVRVPFMKMQGKWFNYGIIEGCKIIRMFYKSGESKNTIFSMYIFLPEETNGLPSLMESINLDANLFDNQIRFSFVCIKKLQIPKFDFECSVSLPKTMKILGLTHIFDDDCHDLVKMVESPENDDQFLYVSGIHHKCRIETNEKGTKAAAITKVSMQPCGAAIEKVEALNFVANHPFMFMIREDFSGSVLFVGTVLDPLSH